jgi:hypothetical protein
MNWTYWRLSRFAQVSSRADEATQKDHNRPFDWHHLPHLNVYRQRHQNIQPQLRRVDYGGMR